MEPADERLLTDDIVRRALDASLHSIAWNLYKRA